MIPHTVSMAKAARPASQKVRNHVKKWRKLRGLTQEQLAAGAKRSRALITQIETGTTQLTEGTLYALAEILDCTPGELLHVDPSKQSIEVAIADELRGADENTKAEALGYIRGLVAKKKQ